jgi:hypothetical protein
MYLLSFERVTLLSIGNVGAPKFRDFYVLHERSSGGVKVEPT